MKTRTDVPCGAVSVIVPTYDSSRTISECLKSIMEQTCPPADVLVVDRYSEDGTDNIARARGAKVIQANTNRSVARNIGAQRASGSSLLFIDSDMILSPTIIKDCSVALTEYRALIVSEMSIGSGFWATCKSAEREVIAAGDGILEAARCFSKETFFRLGGYDPLLESGEDWDLHSRAVAQALPIGRVGSVIVHNEGKLTLANAMIKKYTYGKNFGRYFRDNSLLAIRQINPLSRILVTSLKIVSDDPIHGLGFFILKTVELGAAAIGMVLSRID